ncbi:MAG: glycosyltransferase family 9 protein, partial [Chlorobi bacterium]|nr:glycosyltransferase family 9 protein [Chlorobiota bacterium]
MKRPRRILIIRPDRIGDVIMATPLIRALRQTSPEAFIAALVRPHTAPLLRHNPHLDRILLDDFEGADGGRKGFRAKVRELRRLKFDTALMLLPT